MKNLQSIADGLNSCLQVICNVRGEIRYFNRAAQEQLMTGKYTLPFAEYISQEARGRFLSFLDASQRFSEFPLIGFNPFRYAFVVKNEDLNGIPICLTVYLFRSQRELNASGASASYASVAYHAFFESALSEISAEIAGGLEYPVSEATGTISDRFRDLIKFVRLHTSVQSFTTGAVREKQPYSISPFFSVLRDILARECGNIRVTCNLHDADVACASVIVELTGFSILTAILAMTLTEVTCDDEVQVSAFSDGSSVLLEFSTHTDSKENSGNVVVAGGLSVLTDTAGISSIRMMVCEVIAGCIGYDIVCSRYPSPDTEGWWLKFCIKLETDRTPPSDLSLKTDDNALLLRRIADAMDLVWNGIL